MKHLKLGCYSVNIDATELGLTKSEDNEFTRDELPDEFKGIYDSLKSRKSIDKIVFINLKDSNGIVYSGCALQTSSNTIALVTGDGNIVSMSVNSSDNFVIFYTEY